MDSPWLVLLLTTAPPETKNLQRNASMGGCSLLESDSWNRDRLSCADHDNATNEKYFTCRLDIGKLGAKQRMIACHTYLNDVLRDCGHACN
jgi:hypothetical protein